MSIVQKVLLEASLQAIGFQIEELVKDGWSIDPKNPLNQVWTQYEVVMIKDMPLEDVKTDHEEVIDTNIVEDTTDLVKPVVEPVEPSKPVGRPKKNK